MAKAEDLGNEDSWGTWEELLLACAVNRHGTGAWDSVAMEVQSRTSSPSLVPTPHNCRDKYLDLRRRFSLNGPSPNDDGAADGEIPWLEELRKLRVAELRREVQRYDVSIVSLQLKVKRLEEERDRSVKDDSEGQDKADPANGEAGGGGDTKKEEGGDDEKPPPPREAASASAAVPSDEDKRLAGDESDRENRSFNESNSTELKEENGEVGTAEEPIDQTDERPPSPAISKGKADPARAASTKEKPVGESSHYGSSDTVARESRPVSPPDKSPDPTRAADTGESADFRESVAESNGAKESSDVQSSASLSKNRRKRKFAGGSSGDEREGDEVSPASRRMCVKSQPLTGFLEIIRSHQHGSLFERRLESQETEDYQLKIRQHVDLEMVRSKLDEGLYPDNHLEFFRDLLLLCCNATVFFPQNSPEFTAAASLRQLVTREMGIRIRKSSSQAAPKLLLEPKPDPVSDTFSSAPERPTSSGPLIACRKRSSITAKASALDAKRAETKMETEEKVEIETETETETKEPDHLSANVAAEPQVFKKTRKERSATGFRGARSGKGRSIVSSRISGNVHGRAANSLSAPSASSAHNASVSAVAKAATVEDKMEKNASSSSLTVAKKRSAANFLNRMKRSTSSSPGILLDTLKNSVNSQSGGRGRAELKKGGKGNGGSKDPVLRQGPSGKQAPATEQSSPVQPKRSVGRPPKKAAMQPSPPVGRGRKEGAEAEVKLPGRKRGRR